jgi:hypothetical protein
MSMALMLLTAMVTLTGMITPMVSCRGHLSASKAAANF